MSAPQYSRLWKQDTAKVLTQTNKTIVNENLLDVISWRENKFSRYVCFYRKTAVSIFRTTTVGWAGGVLLGEWPISCCHWQRSVETRLFVNVVDLPTRLKDVTAMTDREKEHRYLKISQWFLLTNRPDWFLRKMYMTKVCVTNETFNSDIIPAVTTLHAFEVVLYDFEDFIIVQTEDLDRICRSSSFETS